MIRKKFDSLFGNSCCIKFSSEKETTRGSWRLPIGIRFIWPAIMATRIMLLGEWPRWDYRHENLVTAKTTIAKSYGVS
jgi:SP family sugar:H+ symporter-like MFS transporter